MVLIGSISYSIPIAAQSVATVPTIIKFTPPPPPPNRGAVGSRKGAASRLGGCTPDNQTVTALVPIYQQTVSEQQNIVVPITKVWGLTNAERPHLFFFVPYEKSSITHVEFVFKALKNNQSQTLYRTSLNPPDNPGIIQVNIPESVAALQAGTMYHWFFKVRVKCNPQQPTQLDYAEGWIQRIPQNTTLTTQLNSATPSQKVALYAANGIWYDVLKTLAELRFAQPQDQTLSQQWANLLNSVGLEAIANQPIIYKK
ncbi:MAG TPA: DUF928 domain-containing protein [Trichormus sp. M33_DOE_039]|nr:DUF928 domain-containing protein [Trichormus sp. M33_DOE_039]